MFCVQILIFLVSALIVIDCNNSLEEPTVDSVILRTEAIIRNTVNKLFSALKLKRNNKRLSEYLIINKFFASLTLQDHVNLNKIINISRVINVGSNGSADFMAAINELLGDGNQKIGENETNDEVIIEKLDDHVVKIIKTFLKTLKEAKDLHEANSYIKINENLLKLIKQANNANTTLKVGQDVYDLGSENQPHDIEFWKPSGRRIYKGERTKIKHYPFMASIQIFNNFQCGGSIIKSDLIITASSCLQLAWNNRFYRENPAFLSVRVGSSFYSGGGEVIPVLEVYFHPQYNPKSLRNNICLLRLTRRIKFSWRARRRVRKIDIDRHADVLPFNTPGITILGWGAKGRSNIVRDPWQNILSMAVLDVYPLRDCQDVYSNCQVVKLVRWFSNLYSSSGEISLLLSQPAVKQVLYQCQVLVWGGLIPDALNLRRLSFLRDIGGPGIYDGTLVGVVSFGSPVCGAADAPTVFTKLGYYADWIDSIMEQEVPYSKKRTTLKPSKPPYILPVRYFPKSTTFKIPPLSAAEMRPIPINEVDNVLRFFDEDLFKEFLKTMFQSKEVVEYQDFFKEVKKNMDRARDEKYNEKLRQDETEQVTSPYIDIESELTTKLIEYEEENVETTTQSNYFEKYTILDDEGNSKSDEASIEDLTKNVDLKGTDEEESIDVNKKDKHDNNIEPIFLKDINSIGSNKNNESVLTLLYLSDDNKNNDEDLERSGENSEEVKGLSIYSEPFLDLTRSKGEKNDFHNVLPEKELYEILSEIIDEEMRSNKTR